MTVMNAGTITANKPFTEEAKAFIVEEFGTPNDYRYFIEEDAIEFVEYYGANLDESFEFIIKHLAPLGYVLNGSVEYYYDFEGRYDIKENKVTAMTKEEAIISDAYDRTLISELERRGYTVVVIKKGE